MFYKSLVGFAPYEYQVRVAESLLEGRNIVLSVPTGAGKTWASIVPFLYARQQGLDTFPQKMIYSLPLRTLANSIYADVTNVLRRDKDFVNLSSIQTGEYSDDPYFEKEIIFSTIDQTLSNFLCFPLSLSQRQANINAGSLIGSYLVFDEFHLLDPQLSMATSLGMLQMLKNLCRVCIMTATLTDEFIQFIEEKFNFEVISLKDFPNDAAKIKSLKPADAKSTKKSVKVCLNEKMSAERILSKHKNKTIVICNRVEKAQQVYQDLRKLHDKVGCKGLKKENIICLHSRFFDKDRKEKEKSLKLLFGKGSMENAILISTQVIEAGMDISCDTMHTDISPINSFLQRAGRCARFENEYGEIYVYDVLEVEESIPEEGTKGADKLEIEKLNSKYLPYEMALCKRSLTELSRYETIDEHIASLLVNDVLTDFEQNIVGNLSANLYNREKIQQSWRNCDKKNYRETIRDIQSIEIILFDLENYNRNEKVIPWQYETISVYRWSFINWAKQITESQEDSDDWIFAKVEQSSESNFDLDWQDNNSYRLKELSFACLKRHFDVVFVNNRYFDYTDAGLSVSVNTNRVTSPIKQFTQKNKQMITFKKDSYYQHNKALLNCYATEFKPKLKFTFSELPKYWGKEVVDWEELIKIVCCFHDYGKLNGLWQKPMKEFQKRKSGIDNPQEILAHTDYDERIDEQLAKACKVNTKPAHAGIGAAQVYDVLYDKYSEEVVRTVSNAILKHHSPLSQRASKFYISNLGLKEQEKLLKEYRIDIDTHQLSSKEGESLLKHIGFNSVKEWMPYLLMVRILRLCDQKATESVEKYYKG
jgi:CRISPR-associated endonuclease/helicase Cas3